MRRHVQGQCNPLRLYRTNPIGKHARLHAIDKYLFFLTIRNYITIEEKLLVLYIPKKFHGNFTTLMYCKKASHKDLSTFLQGAQRNCQPNTRRKGGVTIIRDDQSNTCKKPTLKFSVHLLGTSQRSQTNHQYFLAEFWLPRSIFREGRKQTV